MKRTLYPILSLMLITLATLLSACMDRDTEQSIALSGQWRGDFGMFYDYIDNRGRQWTFDSYDTRITFTPAYNYARRGRGTQVDYYHEGPYEYQYYSFSWEIINGVVYLTYDYDHQLDTRITDYRMTNDYFSGVFSNTGTAFRLYKMVDFYDWRPYSNTYGYDYRDDWTYGYPYRAPLSRTDTGTPSDSTSTAGQVVRLGRR